MSYEYGNKRIIENFVRRYTTNVSDEVGILFELEHVYTQAAKADEYEAKAKAFDAYHSIISKHIEQQYSHNKHDMVNRFVKIHDEYESGGSDE